MCGVGAVIHKDKNSNINNILYELLFNLQHRGQDSSGFVTFDEGANKVHITKKLGLVDLNIEKILECNGNMGIGHIRYPTQGSSLCVDEIQPLYENIFDGISLAHNGNLTNIDELKHFIKSNNIYLKSNSDSEMILKIFVFYLQKKITSIKEITPLILKNVVENIYEVCRGSYSIIVMINNYGLLLFRDIYGIKPLVYSVEKDYIAAASETIAFQDNNNYYNVRNGDIVVINEMNITTINIKNNELVPCLFEYIYFASPESYINNILVYEYRDKISEKLIQQIKEKNIVDNIDCVIPIPQTGIITAVKIAEQLKKPIKNAVVKNRYTHRTFINKNHTDIVKNIKKIKIINKLVNNKNVLVVDDSIVRGNTSKYIVSELRKNNVNKIYFVSCCPPIKYPNKYGIAIPSFQELIAHNRSDSMIKNELNVDELFFLDLDSLCKVLNELNPCIKKFETSVFTGKYIT